jgi:hypothetical protein
MFEEYFNKFDTLTKQAIFKFNIGDGGIGDYFKFFTYALVYCMKRDIKLYYYVGNTLLNNYIKLKCTKLYTYTLEMQNTISINRIDDLDALYDGINHDDICAIIIPQCMYNVDNTTVYTTIGSISEIFYFTEEVINLAQTITHITGPYKSIHLRLGDKFLETDKSFIFCIDDVRSFNESSMIDYIQKNISKPLFFFCDNATYKQKIKNQFNNITITDLEIAHTSLSNTTDKQYLHTCVEFYILLHSDEIYSASLSSFSMTASRFNTIPLINNQYI